MEVGAAPAVVGRLADASAANPGFAFYKPKLTKFLEQGDLIPRSAHVINVTLREYHGYHVEKADNELFAVLTQSCDLVKHPGRGCKARYIALAPARPLRLIIEREFSALLVTTPGNQFLLGSMETKERYAAFLEKLINNNDSRYFFLPAKPESAIAEDMCVILPLSLAIRADHYDACMAGRIAQVDDLFQAKLGWLLGQQYSRVGTPDWEDVALGEKIRSITDRSLTWFPPHMFDQIKKKVREFEKTKEGVELSEADLDQMRESCVSKLDSAINATFKVLVQHKLLPEANSTEKFKLRQSLRQSTDFNRYFREDS